MKDKKVRVKKPSQGVGDTVARLAEVMKFDKIADKLAQATGKEDCGCKKRQQKLNEMFPYNK